MSQDPDLIRVAGDRWTNLHGTVQTRLRERLTIFNRVRGRSTMAGMKDTAGRIQAILADAAARQIRLRPVGSRWSFSNLAAIEDGWALEIENLDMSFAVTHGNLDPAYRGTAEELYLAQCGQTVSRINIALETPQRARALRTSGASNGQTVAGMIGTGTHGSALQTGAFESQVAGIQLLTATQNLWLERPGDPVMNAAFAAKLGATLRRDDALFRAALVNLGALGIVHAVLLRTTGRYKLLSSLKKMKMAEVGRALNTLDFTGVPLPEPTLQPYFFLAVVEPSTPDDVYVTVRYKINCEPGYAPVYAQGSGYEAANDLPGLVGKLLDVAPALRPVIAPLLIKVELGEFSNRRKTPGETYNFTTARSGVAGSAMAIPLSFTLRALEIAREVFLANPGAPVAFACRYAQKSPALLGFTRFDPTCILDVDGVDTAATRAVMEGLRARFDAEGVPYAQHWGKLLGLTRARLRASYGSAIDDWNRVRRALLPTQAERDSLSTPLFDSVGLNA
ncbi:MAG TPA: FAD-binding protein [Allosphingosinicella sp.]|nr:FAD-binding protein [Allosphingosinicella sp.]